MNRTALNLIIDLTAAAFFLGMIATGYLLYFPLPPGSNKELALWGLTRHGWGNIHFWLSLGLLAVVLVHVVEHWSWLVTVIRRRLRLTNATSSQLLVSGLVTTAVLLAAFAAFAWAAHRDVVPVDTVTAAVCPPPGVETPAAVPAPPAGTAKAPSFWSEVYPVLERSCLSCHGPRKAAGGFRIDHREDYFGKGGAGPLVVPGNSAASPLVAIVSGAQKGIAFPDRHTLPPHEVAAVKAWIDAGAEWPAREH